MKNTFAKLQLFLEEIKFEHSLFALPFAYLGLFMAAQKVPSFFIFIWVTVAMVSFRTMAMGLNRILDAAIDAKNPRTEKRALPSGKLKKSFIWAVVAISLGVFEFSAYRLGSLCFLLTPLPIVLAWLYPFMKRISWFSHFALGSVLAIAPYGAWIASRGTFDWVPAFISLGVFCWVAGFDMIYALQDVEFDRKEGLHSFPSKFGQSPTLAVTQGLHVMSLVFWALAGYLNGSGVIYAIGLLVAAAFLIREHWLIRSFGVAKINEAFFAMNAVVSIGIFAAAALDIIVAGRIA